VLVEQSQPTLHQHVVVGLVTGGAAERVDTRALGEGDPDLGDQHALQVEGHHVLDRSAHRTSIRDGSVAGRTTVARGQGRAMRTRTRVPASLLRTWTRSHT